MKATHLELSLRYSGYEGLGVSRYLRVSQQEVETLESVPSAVIVSASDLAEKQKEH
jgi:hypothetical protein